jgi:hypothetical protein
MKISEFLHKNDQKTDKKWIKIFVQIAIYVLLIYTFGKIAYMVFLGARLTSKFLGY